jgi:ATP-dependent DNA ligase
LLIAHAVGPIPFPHSAIQTVACSSVSRSRLTSGFFSPCLPQSAQEPPDGPGWLHEIKHDGFRIMARRDSRGVRLFTRNGYDFADRFPLVVQAISGLPARSCLIDGEVIVVDERRLHLRLGHDYGPRAAQSGAHVQRTEG